jgi:hypothetical protein
MKTWGVKICYVLVAFVTMMSFRPILPSRENSKVVKGVVTEISEGGVKDAVFHLSGSSPGQYYINRGLENSFNLTYLRKSLLGKQIEISYADHWTPLDPFGDAARHITELKVGNKVLHTEL